MPLTEKSPISIGVDLAAGPDKTTYAVFNRKTGEQVAMVQGSKPELSLEQAIQSQPSSSEFTDRRRAGAARMLAYAGAHQVLSAAESHKKLEAETDRNRLAHARPTSRPLQMAAPTCLSNFNGNRAERRAKKFKRVASHLKANGGDRLVDRVPE